MRLDKAVLLKLQDTNRSNVQKLIKSGLVVVNDKVIKTPAKNISESDSLKIHEQNIEIKLIPDITIIYEDDDCIVLDKPRGLLTHGKGADLIEPTIASWLNNYLGVQPKTNRDLIVHRLDRATSGVIICAKNDIAHKFLQKQFSTRKVEKKYIALVKGTPEPAEAIINAPIERNPKEPSRFRVSENGKNAVTHYKVIKSSGNKKISLLELSPKTGRTHQLRVHMNYIHHPIVGDDFYKGPESNRLYLHASSLKLKLPNGETKKFVSNTPKEFYNL